MHKGLRQEETKTEVGETGMPTWSQHLPKDWAGLGWAPGLDCSTLLAASFKHLLCQCLFGVNSFYDSTMSQSLRSCEFAIAPPGTAYPEEGGTAATWNKTGRFTLRCKHFLYLWCIYITYEVQKSPFQKFPQFPPYTEPRRQNGSLLAMSLLPILAITLHIQPEGS